jgi:hypothetical protein
MKKEGVKKSGGKFRFVDFLVILLCLLGAAYSIDLFRRDLFQTLSAQNETPIGTVSIKKNTVQRRMASRVIWDRLIKESPVYSNDTIRVAELSEADLHVGGNDITMSENTLIRLRLNKETGEFQIELASGNIGLVTADEKVILNIMGRHVEAAPGTALTAAAGNKGMELQVNEGAATVKGEDGSREFAAGTMIALDSEGSVRSDPAVVMIQPRPNTRYWKAGNEAFIVDFSWNRINFQRNDTLRLEIAEDQTFSRIVRSINGLYDSAQAALDTGLWNWRLTLSGTILSSGRLTVTDAEPELLSPARNQQFYYENEPPKLYFQWLGLEDVSHYVLEVDTTPEFRNPIIRKQTPVTSFTDSSLGTGIWYWRVLPVFSQTFERAAVSVSRNAAFRIVKGEEPQFLTFVTEEPPPAPFVQQPAPASQSSSTAAQPLPSPPKRIILESPDQAITLQGLTALRQQTVFRWSSEEAVTQSRFVLSRNSNPLTGRPAVEILDPNRTIRLDRLEEGTWYWTVEAQTSGGVDITAQMPRQLRVLPIPLLPAPTNLLPAAGQRIGIEELKKVNIDFSWSAAAGANAYIFTLYQENGSNRRQITQIGPENRTSWTTDVKALGRGNFVWQVEAVNVGRNNVIEQRGRPGQNSFVIDIPRPGPVRLINSSEGSP